MKLVDQLTSVAHDPGVLRGSIATVTAVGGVGVDLDLGGSVVPEVPCAATYSTPAEGDVVLVVKLGSGWLVVCSLGDPLTGGPNLMPNPAMENGTLGGLPDQWSDFWQSGAGAGVDLSSTYVHGGSRSARMRITASGSASANSFQTTEVIPVASGTQYRVSYWARASRALAAGETWQLNMLNGATPSEAQYFGGGSLDTLLTTKPTTSWVYYEALWTPGTGEDFTRPTLRIDATSTASTLDVYVDDLSLRTV